MGTESLPEMLENFKSLMHLSAREHFIESVALFIEYYFDFKYIFCCINQIKASKG